MFIILTKFSALSAPEIVILDQKLSIYSAANDEN